jgi:hypothetical protein
VQQADARGCSTLRGSYRPSAKNALVADLYPRLGFRPDGAADGTSAADDEEPDGTTHWLLPLAERPPAPALIDLADRPAESDRRNERSGLSR